MNLNELEYKGPKKQVTEIVADDGNDTDMPQENVEMTKPIEETITVRSRADWMLILKLVAALSLVIGILVGMIPGFFVGKLVYEGKTVQNSDGSNTNNNGQTSIYDQFDYSKIVINASKNVTVESFYEDNEERFYAMQIIGTKMPELKYLDSTDQELSIKDLGEERYIIEFIEPNCAYCNKMIEVIDAYRETENAYNLLGMSIKSGDISKFNEKGEHTYMLINKDEKTDALVELVVWVPTIVYVEKGEIKLVTFGLLDSAADIQKNADIAFNRGE